MTTVWMISLFTIQVWCGGCQQFETVVYGDAQARQRGGMGTVNGALCAVVAPASELDSAEGGSVSCRRATTVQCS
jgi:hypothetical protein